MGKVFKREIMKIAFSGPQGTGKTTLLKYLKGDEEFRYKYKFIDEITRRVQKKGYTINEKGDNYDTTQLLIMNEHLSNLFEGDVIMDRCMLDGLVYTNYLYWEGKVSFWIWEYARRLFYEYGSNYDYIFYLAPEFDLEDDGVRSINKEFRDSIENWFEALIGTNSIPVIRLTGSVEDRIKQFKETING